MLVFNQILGKQGRDSRYKKSVKTARLSIFSAKRQSLIRRL